MPVHAFCQDWVKLPEMYWSIFPKVVFALFHFSLILFEMAFMALPILVFNVVKALTAPSLRATVFFTTQSFMAAHFAHTVSQFFPE